MSEFNGIIYKATNLINGKVYIGQTTKALHERILQHKKDSIRLRYRNLTFYNAFNKYGFENFNWCIIDQSNSKGDLDNKECYWIDFYKSYIHHKESNGYNMTFGGDGMYGYKPTKETIKKMVLARKGYRHSDETKLKQSEAHKGIAKTEEHKKKLSESKKGKFTGEDSPRSRAIMRFNLDGAFIAEYPTVTDGAKAVDGNTTKISRCCAGAYRHRSHKDSIWVYKNEYTPELVKGMVDSFNKKIKGRPTRAVVQLDSENNLINRFDSIKESVEKTGCSKGGIIQCCTGKRELFKGFKWVYEDDYNV